MKYLLALLCLLVIGGTFFSYSVSAQKESKNGKVSLADQMGRLADSIDKLLEKSSNTNATPETNIIDQNNEDFALQATVFFNENLPCLGSDYQEWPKSFTKKQNASWDLSLLKASPQINQFIDINGDGLLDFLSANGKSTQTYWYVGSDMHYYRYGTESSCVLLNNGAGWDIAYRCKTLWNNTEKKLEYFGECADLSA